MIVGTQRISFLGKDVIAEFSDDGSAPTDGKYRWGWTVRLEDGSISGDHGPYEYACDSFARKLAYPLPLTARAFYPDVYDGTQKECESFNAVMQAEGRPFRASIDDARYGGVFVDFICDTACHEHFDVEVTPLVGPRAVLRRLLDAHSDTALIGDSLLPDVMAKWALALTLVTIVPQHDLESEELRGMLEDWVSAELA